MLQINLGKYDLIVSNPPIFKINKMMLKTKNFLEISNQKSN